LTGRQDRLFISGGENIQPEEIEHALCRLPGILAAKVVAQSDPEFGHRPIAYLLEQSRQHSVESIRAALKDLLPSFKHPVQIYPFTEEMLTRMKV
jgi:O-succinylbenzoic acid--CoA ligase